MKEEVCRFVVNYHALGAKVPCETSKNGMMVCLKLQADFFLKKNKKNKATSLLDWAELHCQKINTRNSFANCHTGVRVTVKHNDIQISIGILLTFDVQMKNTAVRSMKWTTYNTVSA